MRKSWLMTVALLAVLNLGSQACSTPQGNSLSVEEARVVLSPLIPNIKIIHVKPSAVDGLWEIGAEVNGRKAIIYLDHAKRHIISPVTQGELIDIKSRSSLTQEAFQEINKIDVSTIPLKDAIVMGSETAANKIIVFSDVDWPYCGRLHQEMKKVIKERRDISFSIILYPLPMHKESYGKSKAILCEKSLDLLDDAFERKPLPAAKCETTAIDDNIKLAQRLGINSTPTLIFPDGMVAYGALDAPKIIGWIDKK